MKSPCLNNRARLINGVLLTFALQLAVSVHAATIVVNTLDGGSVPGQCSLFDAVWAATTNAPQQGCAAGDPGQDTIEFAPGLSGTIAPIGQLVIGEPLIINGNPGIEIDGGGVRIFLINPGADTELRDLILRGGGTTADNEPGGAIYSQADLLMRRVVIHDSRTHGDDSPGGAVAIVGADLDVRESEFFDNHTHGVDSPGGAIYIIDGDLEMHGTTVENNRTHSTTWGFWNGGGGIYLLTSGLSMHDSRIIGNQSAIGTAGLNLASGRPDPIISRSTIANNVSMGLGSWGCAGLSLSTALNVAQLDIDSSTINDNTGGVCLTRGTLRVVNSTVTNNIGGGFKIFNNFGAPAADVQLRLLHTTVADNLNTGFADEIATLNNVIISASNSIIANSIVGGQTLCDRTLDVGTSTNNLATDASCGTGSLVGGAPVAYADLVLQALFDNGGPTRTRAISAGSMAVDAAHNPSCSIPAVNGMDQRTAQRPGLNSSACDIGAFELQQQPELTLSQDTVDFGHWCRNAPGLSQSVTLENTGLVVVTVSGFGPATPPPFGQVPVGCQAPPFDINPGDSCERTYTFNPISAGSFTEVIDLVSNTPSSPQAITLMGSSEDAIIFLPLSTLDFGQVSVGGLASLSMPVQNQSLTCAFNIAIPAIMALPPEFAILPGSCGPNFPVSLNAGESCHLEVQFAPTAIGMINHPNELGHLATSGDGTYTLMGEGVPSSGMPDFTLDPPDWDFGSVPVGSVASGLVELTSTGTADLQIIDTIIAPSPPYALVPGGCSAGMVLSPSEFCTIEFEFQPLSAATFDGVITVDTDAGIQNISLTGTGTVGAGQLVVTPALVDFGQWCLNELAPPATVSLENIGGAALSVDTMDSPVPPFGPLPAPGDCSAPPFTLDAGDACTRSFNFLPLSSGSSTQTLTVVSSNPTATHSFELVGQALDVLIDGVIDIDFGAVAIGSTSVATMSLTNPGGSCSLEVVIPDAMGPLPPEFDITPGTCPPFPFVLGPGDGCELEVSFSPLLAGPVSHGNMLGSDATAGTVGYVLTGEGDDAPLFHDRFEDP